MGKGEAEKRFANMERWYLHTNVQIWLWPWGLDGDTGRSAGLGDVVHGTDRCPASAAAQLEQVAHFSECPVSRFYLQNRNKKFYLVEFLKEI